MKHEPRGPRAAIDWSALHLRLDAAHHARAESTPEQNRRLLDERAAALARSTDEISVGTLVDLVIVALGEERCAIEARHVNQIVRRGEVAPIPGARPPVTGITAWRGGLLTLLDLRAMLNLAPEDGAVPAWIVVLGDQRSAIGVLVDAVTEVSTVTTADILPAPPGGRIPSHLLRGMTGSALQVLDLPSLLLRHAPESTGTPEE